MIRAAVHRTRALVRAAMGSSALILTYHRVADLPRDPQLLAVSPARFEAQAAMLASRFQVVPLAELVTNLRERRVHDRTIALTFDDGYADNLERARPVLESHNLPATVFVSSGYLGGDCEFWWDEAERIVLGAEPADRWSVLEPPRTEAHRAYLELMDRVHPLPTETRDAALAAARDRFAVAPAVRPTHRTMTADEVAVLDSSPVIEVGAHSTGHEVLSALDAPAQRASIARDKTELERICGRELRLFSYPYGGRGDFTAETTRIVRETGFAGACANYPGLVKSWVDPYELPRFVVRDWSGDELARRLDAWFAGRKVAER